MVLINKAINEVTVKLVYYGPGLCGKTTNLEKIYGNPKLENKGKMISMATETDRTLFFDFMPMELGTIGGQKVRVQLYTVPGQVFYDATRKLVLRGADGVVFVADSQNTMRESNLQSLDNLKTNLRLNRLDPDKVAIVYQLNKRDLPNVDTVETMREYMQTGSAPTVEAAAIQGVGVTATLRAAVARILDNLKNKVDTTLYEESPLTAPDMSAKAGVTTGSAGTMKKLSVSTDSAARAARPSPAPRPSVIPDLELDEDPLSNASPFGISQPADDDDPFGSVAVAEPEVEAHADPFGSAAAPFEEHAFDAVDESAAETPFGEPRAIHDASAERDEIEQLLSNTRQVIYSLEMALEHARESERTLTEKLARL